jgi:6-phosphogluconolactonase
VACARVVRGRRSACRVGVVVGLLAWLVALSSAGALGEPGAIRVGIGIDDHPGLVRVVVDFARGSLTKSQVDAIDPRPFDGAAGLRISHLGDATRAITRSSHQVSVGVRGSASRVRVAIRSAQARFKYLSYTVVGTRQLVIDLWKSAPPSGAAELRRGQRGCLSLDSLRVLGGVVSVTGRERKLSEKNFAAVVRGHDGRVLARASLHAAAGRWSAQVQYRAAREQVGTLEGVAQSAKDGALACLVQVAVDLFPSPAAATAGRVYVINSEDNQVAQYGLAVGEVLTPESFGATGTGPDGVGVSPDGRAVYVANNGSNAVSEYNVGKGTALPSQPQATVAAGPAPDGIVISPNGASVYVTNSGDGTVSQYGAGADGRLTPKSPAIAAAGSAPRGIAVTPDGMSIYVTNEGDNTVSQYSVGADGTLAPKSPATVATGMSPVAVAVSPDGTSVYVTGIDGVSQYDVGAAGALTPKSPASVAAPFPFGIAVSPDGNSVYVTAFIGNAIYQFDVGIGGVLTPKAQSTAPAGNLPAGIVISPDGKSAYVTNQMGNNLSEYDLAPGGVLRPKFPATVPTGRGPRAIAMSR